MGKGGGTVLFPHLVNIAKMGYGLNRNPLFLMVGIGKVEEGEEKTKGGSCLIWVSITGENGVKCKLETP
jgi:hypothetical protein